MSYPVCKQDLSHSLLWLIVLFQSLACAPAMILHTCTRGEHAMKKLLVRGDSEGQVVIWILPEVSERQMTLVRQESFDRLPG